MAVTKYMKKCVGFLIVMCVVLGGCLNQEHTIEPDYEPSDEHGIEPDIQFHVLKGVSLSPRSFESSDFTNFFEEAKQAGSIVSWAGDWNDLGTDNRAPTVVTELASGYGYIPLIIAQFFIQSEGKLVRPLNEETKQYYLTSAALFAEKYTPQYLAFGIEVNVLYEKSPQDFDEFVTFYSEVYDAVKAKSPTTKVFTIFQLERMKGLHGGLFGGVNDLDNTEWWLLDKFPKSDIIGFTTYPGLIFGDPSDIPPNYYTEITLYTEKPVAFTEIGWHSSAAIPGWESSEVEQADFVETFFRLTKDVDMEIAIWSFLYDPDLFEPFSSMGLRRSDGNARLAWDAWVSSEWKIN